jgi:hypothetical protein
MPNPHTTQAPRGEPPIVLWGLPEDTPLRTVQQALRRKGSVVTFIDQGAVLATDVELEVGATVQGWVRTPEGVLDLHRVTAAYVRPHESVRLPLIERAGPGSSAWQHAVRVDDVLWSWADLTEALVINRPCAMASNNSKPYQASLIRAAGFATPTTLVTTDPEAARAFWAEHHEVIYKSISGVRSIVSRLSRDHEARLKHISSCPTQFQAYIAGTDYRVHVVGERVFACEIVSAASDYRYATSQGMSVVLRPATLPETLAERCWALASALSLPVARIDLRHSTDESWYCFEVNLSPAFTYYQDATGQPIDDAIAELLLSTPDFDTN